MENTKPGLHLDNLDNEVEDVNADHSKSMQTTDKLNVLPSEENINIKKHKNLPDKELNIKIEDDDLQKIIGIQMEKLTLNESKRREENEDHKSMQSTKGKCMYQQVLRKRGPDRHTMQSFHAINNCPPYAKSHSETDHQVWVSKPRESHKTLNDYSSSDSKEEKAKEEEAIHEIVRYLNCPYETSKLCHLPYPLDHPDLCNCNFTTDEMCEALLDIPTSGTTLNSTPPIDVPENAFAAEQNYSPQSTTSTDDGYISEHYRSMPNSPAELCIRTQPLPALHDSTHRDFSVAASSETSTNISCVTKDPPTFPPENNFVKKVPIKKRNEFLEGCSEKLVDKCRREILKKGREIGLNKQDSNHRTLLHVAIEKGEEIYALVFIGMIEKSFQNGTKKGGLECFPDLQSFLDQEDVWGRTPLLLACLLNMGKVVSYLLKCGVNLSARISGTQQSVLHHVCERGSRLADIAKVLCECAYSKQCISMRNSKGETPLHVAVSKHGRGHRDECANVSERIDNKAIVSLLLENGAEVDAQDVSGQTAIHKVIMKKHVELLQCLHISTSTAEWTRAVNVQDYEGLTPLHWAVCCQGLLPELHRKLIECLLAINASPGIRDRKGRLPLDLIPNERADLIKTLDPGYYTIDKKKGLLYEKARTTSHSNEIILLSN